MKHSRFTDEQIIGFRKQADAGVSVKELCRSGGLSSPACTSAHHIRVPANKDCTLSPPLHQNHLIQIKLIGSRLKNVMVCIRQSVV